MNNTVEYAATRLKDRMLQEIAPDLYNACQVIVNPLLNDLTLVPRIISEIQRLEGDITCENIHFALAVLDRLYVPAQLLCKGMIKKPAGVRDAYGVALGYHNPENINRWADIAFSHYKNPRFANRVDQIAFKVYDILKTNGEITEKYREIAPSPQPFENFKNDGFLVKMVKTRISGINEHISAVENALLF